MKDNMNIIDKFLYKLLIGLFCLLVVFTLNKFSLINVDNMKNELSKHINFLNIIDKINGKIEIIPLDIEKDKIVNYNLYEIEENDKVYKIKLGKYEAVESYCAGVVINIHKNTDNTFKVEVQSSSNINFFYDKLSVCDVNMYQVIDCEEIIGKASYDNENYFVLSAYEKNNKISLFEDK